MTRRQANAPDRYVANRDKAIEMLDRMLKHLQADRQSRDPSTANWSDVGTMADYVETLQRTHDAMFHEGEHAEV